MRWSFPRPQTANYRSALWMPRAVVALLLLLTMAVFWLVPSHEFVLWDDPVNVAENPYLHSVALDHILAFWRAPYAQLYIPFTYTLWALAAAVSRWLTTRLDPQVFHSLSLLVHLLSVLVVWRIVRLLIGRTIPEGQRTAVSPFWTRAEWAAGGGALLFAIHPLQVEAVSWVTGLKDVLCGYLSCVAVWFYMEYASGSTQGGPSGKPTPEKALPSHRHYWLATGAFVLALLAKPTAVIVPVVVCFLDIWGWPQTWHTRRLALLAWVGLASLWGLVTSHVQPETPLTFLPPLWARPLIAGDAVAFYLYKLGLPLWLGPDYGRSPESVVGQSWLWLTGLLPWGLAAWLWYRRVRVPWLVAAAGVFVAGLLPVLGFVSFAFQGYSTVADRYTYVAMLGPALALAWGLAQSHRSVCAVGCVIVLGLFGIRSAWQTRYWYDTVSLFKHALTVHPGSSLAHNNLGMALARQGQLAEARQHYVEAVRWQPRNAEAHNNLGNALSRQGRTQEAMQHYTEALRLQPTFAEAHNNLGSALVTQGRMAEAIHHYTEALRLQPWYARAHYNLGNTLSSQGKTQEAMEQYTIALRLQPAFAEAHNNLGAALVTQGRMAEAIYHYTEALRHQPRYINTRYNLAIALARQGRLAEARRQVSEVLRLDPNHTAARRLLESGL